MNKKNWTKIIAPTAIIATIILRDQLGLPITEGMMENVLEFIGICVAALAAYINTDK